MPIGIDAGNETTAYRPCSSVQPVATMSCVYMIHGIIYHATIEQVRSSGSVDLRWQGEHATHVRYSAEPREGYWGCPGLWLQ